VDCEDGWLCVEYTKDDFVFGPRSKHECMAPCSSCPERWQCTSEAQTWCDENQNWQAPVVTASASPEVVEPGGVVTFTAAATSPVGDTVFYYAWYLDDEATSDQATFQHTLNEVGTHRVDLKVVGADALHPTWVSFDLTVCEGAPSCL